LLPYRRDFNRVRRLDPALVSVDQRAGSRLSSVGSCAVSRPQRLHWIRRR
jgi:hypothetical protein